MVAHENANAAMFEDDYMPSESIEKRVEEYDPEEYTPTFVLDNVDYEDY